MDDAKKIRMNKITLKIFGGCLALILVIVAFGAIFGGGSETTEAKSTVDCLSVDSDMGISIMSESESGTGAKFVKASAVRSPNFKKVYFIAVEFSAPGVDNQVGVFASNVLTTSEGRSAPLAVDGTAQSFTTWPDADKTTSAISVADPSVDTAKACIK